jgi:hypothetical protein
MALPELRADLPVSGSALGSEIAIYAGAGSSKDKSEIIIINDDLISRTGDFAGSRKSYTG